MNHHITDAVDSLIISCAVDHGATATPAIGQAGVKQSKPAKSRKLGQRGAGSVFEFRGGWRAQVTLPSGQRRVRDWPSHKEANQWRIRMLADAELVLHGAELGGPTQCNLAEAMWHYAHLKTLAKRGVKAELQRISVYLEEADFPLLRLGESAAGGKELKEID